MENILSKVTYEGELRTNSIHLKSGKEFITDAPVDNNGKGNAFSPTDMVATNLATCMLTIMGIKARDMEIDLIGAETSVEKIMASSPRRIAEINIEMTFNEALKVDEKAITILERAAMNCPVFKSLHPDISTQVKFNWPS